MLTSRSEVSEVHCVKDAKVPLMQFKLDGISIDLPYAQLKVMFVLELSVMHVEPNLSKQSVPAVVSAFTQGSHNVDILNPFFLRNIDETSWRSLSGVHANKCILRFLPNMKASSMLSMGSYVLSLTIVPAISIVVRQFGRFLRKLPHSTQSTSLSSLPQLLRFVGT
ncbi:Nuclear poly(A) polymerase 3 [Camellia lanceoleosa]|uniref:Nuclear poly(A) polymerase 3 n=1 Tax=Camellia lanceoleosa TaxID=1840588 RepID=A0ACC0GKY8_9ERIC|nr:Nuclear poly(A) polymerase 3 [Camellia lanceoleosa]